MFCGIHLVFTLLYEADESILFNSILSTSKPSRLGSCLTICQSVILAMIVASCLTACNPGSTTNNYGVNKAGMSGGGATKDPGDGTGGSTGDGGGGQGIECGDSNNTKIRNRLFVRDVYEALNDQKLQMKTIPNDSTGGDAVSAEAIKVLVSSIRSYFGPASPNLEFTNEDFWKNFSKRISFIDDDRELHASQDANSPIALPNECRVVQIAYWSDSSEETDGGTLYVSGKYWRQLDQLNKIALMGHEFFFKQARRAHYKNSDTVRFKIGQMLSANDVRPLFNQWTPSKEERAKEILPTSRNGFKICKGTSSEEPAAKLHFYQYEGKDGRQYFTIPLLTSNSINLSFLNDSQFSFDPTENTHLAVGTDLLVIPPMWYSLFYDGGNEYRGGLFGVWFARWYSNIGEIKTIDPGSTLSNFIIKFDSTTKMGGVLWSESAGPANDPVKIELLNHTHALKELQSKVPKNREELIKEIHRQMRGSIETCFWAKEEQVNGAILIVDNEVQDFITSGTFPSGYPQWTSAIQNLKPRPWDVERGGPSPCENKKGILLDLPNALLNVSANNYDEGRLAEVLGTKFFLNESIQKKPVPGLVRLSQSNRSLEFNLICENYDEVYFKKFGIKNALKTDLATQDKIVSIAPHEPKAQDASNEKKVQTDFYYKKFSNFLEFNKDSSQNFQRLITAYKQSCNKSGNLPRQSCEHYESFLAELSSEKNIHLNLCPESSGFDEKEYLAICVVAKMKTTQNSYIIYVSRPKDTAHETQEAPTIDLVRMVPAVQ